jgi:fumarate reductase flavoprotein subunit
MSPETKGYAIAIPERKAGSKLEADVVVIGGGGAGLPAALTALEEGARNVIVLEKRFATGGDGLRCNHIFAVGSRLQKEAGITITADEIFKRALEFHRYDRVNPRILRTLINKTADTISWLEGKGAEFKLFLLMSPDPKTATTHVEKDMPLPDSLCSLGKVFRRLTQKSVEAGVQFMVRTSGKKIIRGADGKVTGVLAQTRDGQKIEIKTGAAILCPGSFVGNKELLKKYFPHYYDDVYYTDALLSNTGDGIQIAAEAGAAMSDFCTLIRHASSFETVVNFRHEFFSPSAVLVNKRGQRYIGESARDISANVLVQQPGKIAYYLYDDKIMQGLAKQEPHMQYSSRLPTPPEKIPESIRDYRKYIQARVKRGWVKIADTWDEIAAWIGCDPRVLKATIARYNAFCERGYDEDFVKDKQYLVPLRTPPYYAIHLRPLMIETIGPVMVNERMEVLDKQGEPIPGFFAAGVITSGWESYDYGGTPSGTALSFSLTTGRIAGESAAKYVLGK